MRARVQERLAGATGAAIVVTALGYLLLLGMRVDIRRLATPLVTILNLPQQEPPRPRQTIAPRIALRKARARAAPRNLKNAATEIVTPPPVLPPPVAPTLVVAPHPGAGIASAAGASDRPGPGQGAGGAGSGTGGGGNGDGDDDGYVPPRQIRGRLKYADLPSALRAAGVAGTVGVRYRVTVDGHVDACVAMRSSGSAELDALTCALIEHRFRFAPSRDPDGRPVSATIEERHSWLIDPAAGQPDAPDGR